MTEIEKIKAKVALEREQRGRDNRAKGHAFEIKVMNYERKNSLYVTHSAGSLGVFDIISFKNNGKIRFITCKVNAYHTPKELESLITMKRKIIAKYPTAEFKLAFYVSPKKYVYRTV